jgi:hypothetical protein
VCIRRLRGGRGNVRNCERGHVNMYGTDTDGTVEPMMHVQCGAYMAATSRYRGVQLAILKRK